MILKKFVSLILTLIFAGVVFASTVSAGEVDRVLATADSAAVMAVINEIGTPLSDADAREMRGEFLQVLIPIAVLYGIPVSSLVTRILSSPGWPNNLINAAGWWVSVFGG